jgi:raffinose/stachyose/melibiose transport system substrate-binding protein
MKATKSAKAFKLFIAAAFALTATIVPLTASQAAGEVRNQKCTNEGELTGTKSTSLECKKNSQGRLVWQRVQLSASKLGPVPAVRAPAGSLEFWHWRAEDRAWFDEIIKRFEAANPGAKVSQVISPNTDHETNALQKIRGNRKAGLVAIFRGTQFNQGATAGVFEDLSNQQWAKRNVIASMMGAGQYQGKQLGIPLQSLFNNPVYNIEIFKKEGWALPKTFNEWLGYCRAAKAKGYVPMAWMGGNKGQAGQIMNSAFMGIGNTVSEVYDKLTAIDTGKEEITTAWFKDVAGKYAQLRDAGCFPDNPKGVTEPAANALFATGKSPILPTGSFSMGGIRTLEPKMAGNMGLTGFNWTNDRNAKFTAITNNTFILTVNKNAGAVEKRIARAFISFMLQGEIAGYYANQSGQHVTVLDVDYTNIDLRNTSSIMSERLILAPRFVFLNLPVRNIVEDVFIEIAGGESVDKAIADGARLIKQRF